MRKTIIALAALLACAPAFAQFRLVPGGMEADNGKDFAVFEIEGTQSELYAKAKTAVTSLFRSAKDAVSCNEPDIIVVNGATEPGQFKIKRMLNYNFGAQFRIQILFKDGRIRVDAPSVELTPCEGVSDPKNAGMSLEMGGSGSAGGTYHLYDKKGKCRSEKTAAEIQDYMNSVVMSIVDAIKGGSADDDW